MLKTEKTLDYVKVKRISERLTGQPRNIRHTSPKFQALIEECNEAVEQVVANSLL